MTEAPQLRMTRDEALNTIREYVLQVTSHVRKKDPQSGALADRLLAPLVHWKDGPTQAGTDGSAPPVEPPSASPKG